jgi:DNA polymerase III epsilon subunit-like protein
MMPTHIMIDLETLGTTPGCAIRSIGAVAFDPTTDDRDTVSCNPEFYANVSLASCLAAGLSIDADTIEWWERQSEASKAALRDPPPGEIVAALHQFVGWNRTLPMISGVWAHGASFDIPIVETAFRRFPIAPPWDYRLIRDTRTLYDLAGFDPKADGPEFDGAPHNALHDARHQARCVRAAYAKLRTGATDFDWAALQELRKSSP